MRNIKSSDLDLDAELIKVPLPETKKDRKTEEEYIDDAVLASNRLNLLLRIISGLVPSVDTSKISQGIMLGHMVRLAKLYDSFLLLICKNKSDAAMLIARSLIETAIYLKYLRNVIDEKVCERFIKASLSYDKKLWEFITSKIGERKPEVFEQRILQTIKDSFSKEGFELDDINFKKDNKWHGKNLLEISESIKLLDVYESMYRLLSRAEHGSWQHLKSYNLKDEGNHYSPQLSLVQPDPQILFSTNFLCIEAALNYLGYIQVTQEKLIKVLRELMTWFQEISRDYGSYKDRLYPVN